MIVSDSPLRTKRRTASVRFSTSSFAIAILLVAIVAQPSVLLATDEPTGSTNAEPNADEVWRSAVAFWPMADARDVIGADSALAPRGEVRLGVELPEMERAASRARGGDGVVAELTHGWLDAGDGIDGELQFDGKAFTAAIRLQAPSGRWTTRGLFARGGGHDALVFNFFSHDFERGAAGMRVGCEIGIAGRAGLAAQVTESVVRIGAAEWHDLVARYDGSELVLFVDGVPVDRAACSGTLRENRTEPLAIGAGTHGGSTDSPFPGRIDHAAIWNRALSDDEIVAISGGREGALAAAEKFARDVPEAEGPTVRELVEAHRLFQRRLQEDPHRPLWHFVCPEGGDSMPFDPNGMIWWQGRYHLFYIFQAGDPHVHHWGHASSLDLLHWTHHPTALDYDADDPDQGIFSGNAFVDLEGRPTILYHGVRAGNSIAHAVDDDLIEWRKSPTNPLVPIPAEGSPDFGKYESWDPHGWVENGRYLGIFGGAKPALFSGATFDRWEYVGPFLETDREWGEPGEDISCPDFFPMGDSHVLLCISHRRGARYFVGRWDGRTFRPESHHRMNWPGGGYFAPETLLDDRGRRILIAWVMDPRDPTTRAGGGWSGVMSLPRVLTLGDAGRLKIEPIEELQRLRHRPVAIEPFVVGEGSERIVERLSGDSLEIEVEFAAESTHPTVTVRRSPDDAERTTIRVDRKNGTLSIDFGRSSLDPTLVYRSWCIFRPDDRDDAERRVTVQTAPLELAESEPLKLRIFLDRSMLEVFANDVQCVTQRIFPTRADALGVSIGSESGEAIVRSLKGWTLGATRPD